MDWYEASSTYWMAAALMAVMGYIKQRELLWRNDTRRPVFSRNPVLPCDYLGAFSLGEFIGYLIQTFGTPLPVFGDKIFARLLVKLSLDLQSALLTTYVVAVAVFIPIVVEIFVDRWYYGTNAFDN